MPGRNSLYNSQGGRGSNQNGRGRNGGRGNDNTRNQTTPSNTKPSTNPKSSTNSNLSLGGHSDVVNSLFGRAGDTNSNSTSSRSNQSNSDTTTNPDKRTSKLKLRSREWKKIIIVNEMNGMLKLKLTLVLEPKQKHNVK
jgi:hypothetical protein